MVKLRIISDIHFDERINGLDYGKRGLSRSPFGHYYLKELKKEPDCVTLIAGDLASSVKNTQFFLEGFFENQPVIFIQGNHAYYQRTNKTIYEITKELQDTFSFAHMYWHFLENDWMWIPGTNEQVAVIGSCFYTDYKYKTFTLESYNKHREAWNNLLKIWMKETAPYKPVKRLTQKMLITENMLIAEEYLNDFKWGKESSGIHITPQTYLKLHNLAKEKIKECYDRILAENNNAKIILMTHHCLSPKCIDEEYKNSKINASYVSNLEKWLDEEFPNIRLIISGHVHTRKDFIFGKNKKRYIVNACGYIPYNEPFKGDIKFNPNLIIDTEKL